MYRIASSLAALALLASAAHAQSDEIRSAEDCSSAEATITASIEDSGAGEKAVADAQMHLGNMTKACESGDFAAASEHAASARAALASE